MALRELQGYLVINGELWICNCPDESAGARALKDLQRQVPRLNLVVEYFRVNITSVDRTGKITEWEKDAGSSLWVKS